MIYLERRPSLPLEGCIRSLWFTRAPHVAHQRERVLPNGCVQMVISLASDCLTECASDSDICTSIAPAILVGPRARFEVIHTRDMAELVGVIFHPGGLGPWLRQRADQFFELSVSLDDLGNLGRLRHCLREQETPEQKLAQLDASLVQCLRGRNVDRRPALKAAMLALRENRVRPVARSLGISERRLHQIFCEDAGISAKLWSRIDRFQRALRRLHTGAEMRWDRLALDCGYYDQSHFSKDFRAFSGIDPTTYSAARGRWLNHVPLT